MNRSDLISHLADLHPQLQIKDVESIVKEIIDALATTLSNGGRIEIRGFGSFKLNYRPPRIGRNPKTGERVDSASESMCHTSRPAKSSRIA